MDSLFVCSNNLLNHSYQLFCRKTFHLAVDFPMIELSIWERVPTRLSNHESALPDYPDHFFCFEDAVPTGFFSPVSTSSHVYVIMPSCSSASSIQSDHFFMMHTATSAFSSTALTSWLNLPKKCSSVSLRRDKSVVSKYINISGALLD